MAWALLLRMAFFQTLEVCWNRLDWASNSSQLDRKMSRQTLGSLAAMQVKSRKPGPARTEGVGMLPSL